MSEKIRVILKIQNNILITHFKFLLVYFSFILNLVLALIMNAVNVIDVLASILFCLIEYLTCFALV